MNYFPIGKRNTYITLDGEKVGEESNELKLKSFFTSYSDVSLPYASGNSVEFNNKLHYLGGGSSGYWKKHYEFDGKQWTQLGSLPYDFTNGSAVVLNGEIHILGAQVRGGDATDAKKHYKWNGTKWTQVSTLPYIFDNGSAVVLNGEIHIMGGNGTGSKLKHYKWNGTTWTQVSTLPYTVYSHMAIVYNGEIHLLGVIGSSHYYFDGNEWVSLGETPINNGYAITMNDGIHLLEKVGSYGSKGFEHYRWDGEVWHSIGTIPYEPYIYPILSNGRIHLLGGYNSNDAYTSEHKQLVRFVEIA